MKLSPAAREKVFVATLLTPGLFFIVTFAFYPILYSVYLSLHRIVLGLPSLGRPFTGLDNYLRLLQDRVALHSLINTLAFVFTTTGFEILCGLVIALVINRSFKGRGIARAAILVPWAIPTVVSSQMWRFIFNDKYGLLNYIFYGNETHAYTAWLAHPSTAFAAGCLEDLFICRTAHPGGTAAHPG